jgi:putative oxidoreductase
MMRKTLDHILAPYHGYGNLLLRLLIGWRLIDGTQDNVFSWHKMLEFRDFLVAQNVGLPLVAAIVSVYAQFIGGALYILGAYIRWAAVVMIINFIAALVIVHLGTSFQDSFQALTMLVGSTFFLLAGAGRISVDEWRLKQNKI